MHVQFSTFAVSIYDDMNTWTSSLKLLDSPAFYSAIHIRPCVPFGRTHTYALIPSNGLPSGMRALKGWLFLKVPFWVIIPCLHRGVVIMERIFAKNHGGPKCCTLRNPSFRRALWSGRFEHFGLERPFNMIEWPQWQYDPWLFSLRSALQRAIYLVWNTPRFTTTHQNKSLD